MYKLIWWFSVAWLPELHSVSADSWLVLMVALFRHDAVNCTHKKEGKKVEMLRHNKSSLYAYDWWVGLEYGISTQQKTLNHTHLSVSFKTEKIGSVILYVILIGGSSVLMSLTASCVNKALELKLNKKNIKS